MTRYATQTRTGGRIRLRTTRISCATCPRAQRDGRRQQRHDDTAATRRAASTVYPACCRAAGLGGGLLSGAFNHHKDQYHSVLDARATLRLWPARYHGGPNGGHTITSADPTIERQSRQDDGDDAVGHEPSEAASQPVRQGWPRQSVRQRADRAQSLVDGVMQRRLTRLPRRPRPRDAASGAASGLATRRLARWRMATARGIFDLLRACSMKAAWSALAPGVGLSLGLA